MSLFKVIHIFCNISGVCPYAIKNNKIYLEKCNYILIIIKIIIFLMSILTVSKDTSNQLINKNLTNVEKFATLAPIYVEYLNFMTNFLVFHTKKHEIMEIFTLNSEINNSLNISINNKNYYFVIMLFFYSVSTISILGIFEYVYNKITILLIYHWFSNMASIGINIFVIYLLFNIKIQSEKLNRLKILNIDRSQAINLNIILNCNKVCGTFQSILFTNLLTCLVSFVSSCYYFINYLVYVENINFSVFFTVFMWNLYNFVAVYCIIYCFNIVKQEVSYWVGIKIKTILY